MGIKACDQCHWSKEKCSFTGENRHHGCSRCRRLKFACTTSRATRRVGRRPTAKFFPHGKMQVWSVRPHTPERDDDDDDDDHPSHERSPHSAEPERLLAAPSTLQTTSDALRAIEDVQQFYAIHMPFMLGANFAPNVRIAAYSVLSLTAPTLTEGYLAFLSLMTGYQASPVLQRDKPDMRKAARGLQNLRSVRIRHEYDAACTLFLGQAMFVFNILTGANSSTARSIARSSIISTRAWYPRLVRIPAMDTVVITPVLLDTVECLARREVPVIRLDIPDRVIVDRYAGLCLTLLPLLYDLCQRSWTWKKTMVDADSKARGEVVVDDDDDDDWFVDIELAIREWKPAMPPFLFTQYGRHEILIMFTQAKVYRLVALLIIHRLRYPFGVEDEAAIQLANGIFRELAFFARSAEMDSTALPVVFPLIVAMLEVEGPGEEILDSLSSFTIHSICAAKLQGFVKQVRAFRKSGFRGSWFDLVEEHLDAAMVP